ncbi:MAG TPA: Ig-like domain-containing protein [Dissulfurispiraceae bacterium]|nr:Ig-like domain-containing protein [Dissulfurispiraceae bacterium]
MTIKELVIYGSLAAILAMPGCKGQGSPSGQATAPNTSEHATGRSRAGTGETATVQNLAAPGAAAVNNPVLISHVEITPGAPRVGDTITINLIPNAGVALSSVPVAYEWKKNGETLSETSNSLVVDGRFKRDDKVEATITVDSGKGPKQKWLASVIIANSPPVITPATELVKVNGSTFSFQVNAKDADGDPLTYSLKSGPPGTIVDPATGKVTFTVPADNKTSPQIEVLVSDGHGGEAIFHFEMGTK